MDFSMLLLLTGKQQWYLLKLMAPLKIYKKIHLQSTGIMCKAV